MKRGIIVPAVALVAALGTGLALGHGQGSGKGQGMGAGMKGGHECMMQGGHMQGGHMQGGHMQGGHMQGGHMKGGHMKGGHMKGGHMQGGHMQGGHMQSGGSGMMQGGQMMGGGSGMMQRGHMMGGGRAMGGMMMGGIGPYEAGVLGLDEQQRQELETIERENAREHWELMQELRRSRMEMRGMYQGGAPDPDKLGEAHQRMSEVERQMLKHHARVHNRMREVLTEEQRERLEEMRQYREDDQ